MGWSIKESVGRAVIAVITKVDDTFAGDHGASVELTPQQQEQMEKHLKLINVEKDKGQSFG